MSSSFGSLTTPGEVGIGFPNRLAGANRASLSSFV
jgi:hypothetical protein